MTILSFGHVIEERDGAKRQRQASCQVSEAPNLPSLAPSVLLVLVLLVLDDMLPSHEQQTGWPQRRRNMHLRLVPCCNQYNNTIQCSDMQKITIPSCAIVPASDLGSPMFQP